MLRMYTLCLAGIIGLGLGAAGCSGGASHPAGTFDLRWDAGATCSAAGATDIYLYVVDSYNIGSHDHFRCSDYQGMSQLLPPDVYTVQVQVANASGAVIDTVDLGMNQIYADGVTPLDVDLVALPTTGTFNFRWSLVWTTGGGTTCSAAGATTVDLDLLDTAGNDYHDTFTCSDYQGTSEPLFPGDYTVAVRAYDASNGLLSEWVRSSVYHIYAGSVTPLPDVVLQVQ